MIANLDTTKIENLLQSQVVGRLGCHAEGLTYVVPISYAYDENYIYCHTHEGKKIEMMRKNPKVCFQVDLMNDMADWESVIAWGEFEEIADANEKKKAYTTLLQRILPLHSSETTHLGAYWPFSGDSIDEASGIFFRIRLHEKTGKFEKKSESPAMPG